jgi:hypothetical protein
MTRSSRPVEQHIKVYGGPYQKQLLLKFYVPPIRVAGVMIRYKDKIIEPDDDMLFSIGSEIKMNMFPTTL